jgi:hypothetical protein
MPGYSHPSLRDKGVQILAIVSVDIRAASPEDAAMQVTLTKDLKD